MSGNDWHIGLVNRRIFPAHHVVVVEDCLEQQTYWAEFLRLRYGGYGNTNASIIGNAITAFSACITWPELLPRWIAVDHDLQWGNGFQLIERLRAVGYTGLILAASGIEANNNRMLRAGATVVIQGKARDPQLTAILSEYERRG